MRSFSLFKYFLILSVLFITNESWGFLELNTFYTGNTRVTDSDYSQTRTLLDVAVGFSIDKKGIFSVGWNYSSHGISTTTDEVDSYTSTQMGPRFILANKDKSLSLGITYNLESSAVSQIGDAEEERWKGRVLKVDAGYNFELSPYFLLGLRMNYSAASYTEKIIGTEDYSEVSYTQTLIYPSLYMIYAW